MNDLSYITEGIKHAEQSQEEGAVSWKVLGVGLDYADGCFLCPDSDEGRYASLSAFVNSKEEGERIVSYFDLGARLDFRSYEPAWTQVKIGACADHEFALRALGGHWHVSPTTVADLGTVVR